MESSEADVALRRLEALAAAGVDCVLHVPEGGFAQLAAAPGGALRMRKQLMWALGDRSELRVAQPASDGSAGASVGVKKAAAAAAAATTSRGEGEREATAAATAAAPSPPLTAASSIHDGGADMEQFDAQLASESEWDPEQLAACQAALAQQAAASRALNTGVAKFSSKSSPFHKARYGSRKQELWDRFYSRHEDRFFKDRHYLERDFPELAALASSGAPFRFLECGCGVGNALFPLVRRHRAMHVFAVDLSARAIRLVQAHPLCATGQVDAYVCDVTREVLPLAIQHVDVALMLFMLSALHLDEMPVVFSQLADRLRPGGTVRR